MPPYVKRSFVAYANGCNWIESAEVGGTTTQNLRQWRQHPDAEAYINQAISLNLSDSHLKFADSAPALAQELIDIALDKGTRSYAKVQAIDTAFKILQAGVTDRQNRLEMQKIKEALDALDALEGNRAPDVIDVESDG